MKILDNKAQGKVIDELQGTLEAGSRFSVLTDRLTVHAYEALRKDLDKTTGARFLLRKWDEASLPELAGLDSETPLQNRLYQSRIAADFARWLRAKGEARLLAANQVSYNQLLVEGRLAIYGGQDFTAEGLGVVPSAALQANTALTDAGIVAGQAALFDQLWQGASDVKAELLAQLDFMAADHPPALVYRYTLYRLFEDMLEELSDDRIIRTQTGFKNSLIWNKLYRFQQDGVMGAIEKLEKYNGCIIADSVGLGKTFEALAVIKYYELRNDRVLVLCPKKLRDNWVVYTVNDKRNLLSGDRFGYDVLNHSDLSRRSGKSGEISLESLNWGNYDLVVIDESHNFRNSGTKAGGGTRYQRLLQEVIRSGVRTKVLMLSATPVNSRMNDLKNQVAFITEAKDGALATHGIASVEKTLRLAQIQFNNWLRQPESGRSTRTLLETMSLEYFKLLDLLTIARSRRHIEKYYGGGEVGRFPDRLPPKNIKTDIDTEGQYPPLSEVNSAIKRLNLAAYTPLHYVRMDKQDEYNKRYDQQVGEGKSVFKQADREINMIHLMRVNLLKRMESSIHSFALTLESLGARIEDLLQRIEATDAVDIEEMSIEDIDFDSPDAEPFLIGNKVKVLIQDMDLTRWRQQLERDREQLTQLLAEARKITADRDAKLARLKAEIRDKASQPLNADNRKMLVFTAFADTAEYLYGELSSWALTELGLHSALVTGGTGNRSTLKSMPRGIDSTLTYFSPRSKEREKIDPDAQEEIDLLIATDCISEGQNLQDCDCVVNYDIHWNPVRIIQRFGRIDRLGSKNAAIQLANFWPNMELDEYINLEARVSGRMVLLDISATGEENIIEYDEQRTMNDLEYRKRQLEQLQSKVLDLEDMEGSLSITDLTFNEFRMDLAEAYRQDAGQLRRCPSAIHSVAKGEEPDLPPGVIFTLKDRRNAIKQETHALAPYYVVYVSQDGEIVHKHVEGKKTLDALRKLGSSEAAPTSEAFERFRQTTRNLKDMDHLHYLLERAISSVVGAVEEKGMASIFSRGGTYLQPGSIAGSEDFQVISWLVILKA